MNNPIKNMPLPPSDETTWLHFREKRARIRHNIHSECEAFWKAFPRSEHYMHPLVNFTDKPSWQEPEPVGGLEFTDRLGLSLRWGLSSTPLKTGGRKKNVLIWVQKFPNESCPRINSIHFCGVLSPSEKKKYRTMAKTIRGAFRFYTELGLWFEQYAHVWASEPECDPKNYYKKGRDAKPVQ